MDCLRHSERCDCVTWLTLLSGAGASLRVLRAKAQTLQRDGMGSAIAVAVDEPLVPPRGHVSRLVVQFSHFLRSLDLRGNG
jgi:hypothetical protein